MSSISYPILDWTKRPVEVIDRIEKIHRKIRMQGEGSHWGLFNGDTKYDLGGIDEHGLIKQIVLAAPTHRKDFYVMDIGAAEFQWANNLADYLDEESCFPKGVKIHIISVRGERYSGISVERTKRCILSYLGKVKVEEIFHRFRDLKFDLVVSRWCFRHLVDPLGTVLQVYNLLFPGSGIFLLDGFYFLVEGEELDRIGDSDRLATLLTDSKLSFLRRTYKEKGCLDQFLLKKATDLPFVLPVDYVGTKKIEKVAYDCFSGSVTVFKKKSDIIETAKVDFIVSGILQGDFAIYDWLLQSNLIQSNVVWAPISSEKKLLPLLPLHQAIKEKRLELFKEYLYSGVNIDLVDKEENTALHIAIIEQAHDFFVILLKRNPSWQLINKNKISYLEMAAMIDREGFFLETLLLHISNSNDISRYVERLFEVACSVGNDRAIQIIMEIGADSSSLSCSYKKSRKC